MVTTQFGIPGLKYAMDLMGFHGGYPRAPLKPLGEEQKLMLQDVFRLAGLLEDRKAQTQHS
jgi:4-hydroxy-2-oxoglutarate aldolase